MMLAERPRHASGVRKSGMIVHLLSPMRPGTTVSPTIGMTVLIPVLEEVTIIVSRDEGGGGGLLPLRVTLRVGTGAGLASGAQGGIASVAAEALLLVLLRVTRVDSTLTVSVRVAPPALAGFFAYAAATDCSSGNGEFVGCPSGSGGFVGPEI